MYRYRKKYSWRRKYTRGKSVFAAAVKRVILKTAESKYKSGDINESYIWNGVSAVVPMTKTAGVGAGNSILTHNCPFAFYLINNPNIATGSNKIIPTQGDGDGFRNGDEIYAKGIMLRIQLALYTSYHNAKVKLFLVEGNRVQGDPANPGEMYHVVTGNHMIDGIQTDRWRVSKLGTYKYKPSDISPTTNNADIFINKWIPFRRKFRFKQDDSWQICQGMKEWLAICGVAYDTTNTVTSVSIGDMRIHATLYYGDP